MPILKSVEYKGPPIHTAGPNTKVVYFIRHGQSTANARRRSSPVDSCTNDLYLDARLTDLGKQQATSLQDVVPTWNVEHVMVSSLTRTLMTALLAFEKTDVPLHANPLPMEFYPGLVENMGRNPSVLRECPDLNALKRFESVNFDAVPDDWWHICGDLDRLEHFTEWLRSRPEEKIAVVSHWGFIHELVKSWGQGSISMDNCAWICTTWEIPPPDPIPAHLHDHLPRKYSLFLMPAGNRNKNGLMHEILRARKEMLTNKELKASPSLSFGALFHAPLTPFVPIPEMEREHVAACLRAGRSSLLQEHAQGWRVAVDSVRCVVDRDPTRAYVGIHFPMASITPLTEQLKEACPTLHSKLHTHEAGAILMNTRPGQHLDFDELWPILGKHPVLHSAVEENLDYGWQWLFCKLTWRVALVSTLIEDESGWSFREEPGHSFPLWF
eukprot:Colp12_sorted_trinity150504_noHs@32918